MVAIGNPKQLDVETITARMEIERQMIYLKPSAVLSDETVPELGITIGQAHMLITHLKKMVEAYEIMRPYIGYAGGVRIVDEDE
jgi:hypothetical protein